MSQFFDCKGVPIYPGDLVRTEHFRERTFRHGKARCRRIHYLYHVVVEEAGQLWMVPVCYLAFPGNDGRCLLSVGLSESENSATVINGSGPPGSGLYHTIRPRLRRHAKTEGAEA